MQTPDQLVEIVFPLQGVDLSQSYSEQTRLTTVLGVNVRTYEPTLNRARGGSRAGLSKYIAGQVNGSHLIQHLASVVDPQGSGLLTGFDPLNGGGLGGIPDPSTNNNLIFPGWPPSGFGTRNPGAQFTGTGTPGDPFVIVPYTGRYVRTGGSGIQPNRNVATHGTPPTPSHSTPAFVQANADSFPYGAVGATSFTLAYTNPVARGNLLIVTLSTLAVSSAASITDSLGTVFSDPGNSGDFNQGFVFTGVVQTSGANTIKVVTNSFTCGALAVLEYTGVDSTGAIESIFPDNSTSSGGNTLTANTGSATVAGALRLILGYFHAELFDLAAALTGGTAGGAFSRRVKINCNSQQSPGNFAPSDMLVVTDLGSVSVTTDASVTFAGNSGTNPGMAADAFALVLKGT